MKLKEQNIGTVLEEWACRFTPADIVLHSLKTGEEVREISLVAAQVKTVEQKGKNPRTGEEATAHHTVIHRYLAAGKAARAYENTPDAVVFSPLRYGQIAHYGAAEYMFKEFVKQLTPGIRLFKPVLCIRVQEQTTEVEERAIIDAGVQSGAQKVFLYQEPLSALLDAAPTWKELRNALVIHIEPRKEL